MPSWNTASTRSRSSSISPRFQSPSHTLRALCAAIGLLVLLFQQALALLPGAGADRTEGSAAAFQPPRGPSSRRQPLRRRAPPAATRRMAASSAGAANDGIDPGVVPLIDVPTNRDGVRLYRWGGGLEI